MTFRYNIKINKSDDSKIEVFVINKTWLAIANEVRTRIACSEKDIFIPELNF